MSFLRALFDYWTSPDNDPWLVSAREKFVAFEKNHPDIAKVLQYVADNTATLPERYND